ncbi:ATP-binding protein [Luteimonas cellulosilyticus]|nr:ATP-binding protein [Luteimonas cellulosilyticus]
MPVLWAPALVAIVAVADDARWQTLIAVAWMALAALGVALWWRRATQRLLAVPADTPALPAATAAPSGADDARPRPEASPRGPMPRDGDVRDAARRDLMRVLPDGVLLLADGRVLYANPAAVAAFGHRDAAMVGLALDALVFADDAAAFRDWLDQDHPGPDAPPRRMRREDGSGFHAALTASHMRDAGEAYLLLAVRDLSDVERMRDDLAARNDELQALAARIFTVQEDERRALSRELHDDIGQSVTAIKLSAGNVLDEPDPERRRDDLEDILLVADATLEKLRDISVLLRPPQLDALGLEAALRWHAARMLRGADLAVELDIAELAERPAREVEQACFRIAQEALTNIVRHARARRVALRLVDGGGGLRLHVDDDGAGFQPDAARGLGVVIMRERAQGVGGHLTVSSAPRQGTRIEAWLPYPSRVAASTRHASRARHH